LSCECLQELIPNFAHLSRKEMYMYKIAMLGTGFIGRFYTMSLQNFRGKDEIKDWRDGPVNQENARFEGL
jgi:hypothetical protein